MAGIPNISVSKEAVKSFAAKMKPEGLPSGDAQMGDVSKFQKSMTEGIQPQQAQKAAPAESIFNPQAGGPFSFDSLLNYTQQHRAGGVQAGAQGMGDSAMKGISQIFEQSSNMDAKLQEMMSSVQSGGGEMSTSQSLMMQYTINTTMINTEIVGKGVSQLVKAIQTPIRGQ